MDFPSKQATGRLPAQLARKSWVIYCQKKNHENLQNFILVLGVRKIDFYEFSGNFLRKNGLEYGITSETTGTREPRVRRRAPCYHVVTDFPFYGFFNRSEAIVWCPATKSESTGAREPRVKRRAPW